MLAFSPNMPTLNPATKVENPAKKRDPDLLKSLEELSKINPLESQDAPVDTSEVYEMPMRQGGQAIRSAPVKVPRDASFAIRPRQCKLRSRPSDVCNRRRRSEAWAAPTFWIF